LFPVFLLFSPLCAQYFTPDPTDAADNQTNQAVTQVKENKEDDTPGKDYLLGYVSDLPWVCIFWSIKASTMEFKKNQPGTLNNIALFGNHFGDDAYMAPALALFYLYGFGSQDSKAKRTALLAAKSCLICGLFCPGSSFRLGSVQSLVPEVSFPPQPRPHRSFDLFAITGISDVAMLFSFFIQSC